MDFKFDLIDFGAPSGLFGFSGWWGIPGNAALQAVSECPLLR